MTATDSTKSLGEAQVPPPVDSEQLSLPATHTQGPWLLIERPNYGYDLCVNGASELHPGGWFVELHGGGFDNSDLDRRLKAEFDANCRLIAAAPDLKSSLAEMIETYGSDDGGGPIAIIERAKAAIARATS